MRSRAFIGLIVVVTACTDNLAELPPGTTTSGQYIDRIEASYTAVRADDPIAAAQKCAALELTNPDVLVSGTTGGVLQPGLQTMQVLPGGGVIQQVGDDFVIARGAAEYNVLGGVTSRVVRFSLVIEPKVNGLTLTAGDLAQAQRSAGYAAPSGFTRVGTWTGSGGADAAKAVRAELDQVGRCMTR